MGKRHPNPRLIKIHRSYTVEEVANRLGVHKNAVREWIKRGLPTIDDQRPKLILGSDLITFLQARRAKNKQPCKPGEMYCLRCRIPKTPADNMVDYEPKTETLGNLFAICPDCGAGMNRRVSLAKLEQIRGQMDITFPQGLRRLVDSS
jgi:hypothetical protein